MGSHPHGRIGLEIGKMIARDLPSRPEWIALAKDNITRWRQLNADAPGLLRCYAEWDALLIQSIEVICANLTSESDECQRLRSNSPFAGALSPQTVWDIKQCIWDEWKCASQNDPSNRSGA